MNLLKKLILCILILFIGTIKIVSANYDVNITIEKCKKIQNISHLAQESEMQSKGIHTEHHKATPSLHLNHVFNAYIPIKNDFLNPVDIYQQFHIPKEITYLEIDLEHSKKPPKL
jgi:hypothetical protein